MIDRRRHCVAARFSSMGCVSDNLVFEVMEKLVGCALCLRVPVPILDGNENRFQKT